MTNVSTILKLLRTLALCSILCNCISPCLSANLFYWTPDFDINSVLAPLAVIVLLTGIEIIKSVTLCAVCGKSLLGQFLANGWGVPLCQRHQQLEPCFSCHQPICMKLTGGGVRYKDGRWICNICRKTAIYDQERAQRLFDDVRKIMVDYGIHIDHSQKIPLRLAGLDEIDRLAGRTPEIEAGITLTVISRFGKTEASRYIKEVVILYGLPKEHMMAIMAHEFGHVWCFLHGFPDLPKRTREGLCELFAYLCLAKRHTADAKFNMKMIAQNHNPEYGDGFRDALKAMSNSSLEQLLERVRTTKAF